jgi:hypothetical protein
MVSHLLIAPQRTKIPEPHLWVRPEIPDIHGIVLATLDHTALVSIPTVIDPAEGDRPAYGEPMLIEQHL